MAAYSSTADPNVPSLCLVLYLLYFQRDLLAWNGLATQIKSALAPPLPQRSRRIRPRTYPVQLPRMTGNPSIAGLCTGHNALASAAAAAAAYYPVGLATLSTFFFFLVSPLCPMPHLEPLQATVSSHGLMLVNRSKSTRITNNHHKPDKQ